MRNAMAKDDIGDKGLTHLTLLGNNPSLWEARAETQAGQAPAVEGSCWLTCCCGLLHAASYITQDHLPASG